MIKNLASAVLCLALCVDTAAAELMLPSRAEVSEFAHARVRQARDLLTGPVRPVPALPPPELDCRELYRRRVNLISTQTDQRPPVWDDLRNQTAVFLGTVWTPAFYYLGYSTLAGYAERPGQAQLQADIDALRSASAQRRCFER